MVVREVKIKKVESGMIGLDILGGTGGSTDIGGGEGMDKESSTPI